jgi:hypothetical protein
MTWSPFGETRVRMALLFAVACSALLVREGNDALRYDAVVPAMPASPVMPRNAGLEGSDVPFDRLAALAPFSPDRRTTPEGEPADAAAAAPYAIRLIGTVAGGDAPFAVCQLGAARTRMLHLGDTLGGWKLQQVAPGRATFIDAARARHELRISSPGN